MSSGMASEGWRWCNWRLGREARGACGGCLCLLKGRLEGTKNNKITKRKSNVLLPLV